jgi:hypothetical protein
VAQARPRLHQPLAPGRGRAFSPVWSTPPQTRGWRKQLAGATIQEALVDVTIKDCEPRARGRSASRKLQRQVQFGLPLLFLNTFTAATRKPGYQDLRR